MIAGSAAISRRIVNVKHVHLAQPLLQLAKTPSVLFKPVIIHKGRMSSRNKSEQKSPSLMSVKNVRCHVTESDSSGSSIKTK